MSAPIKRPKFKPALSTPTLADASRKPTLTSFCTPGFQKSVTPSAPAQSPNCRREVIYISSDSTPSTSGRSAIKRDSSDMSVASELSPQASKRLKMASNDKENFLRPSLKVNRDATLPNIPQDPSTQMKTTYDDLSTMPLETMNKYLIYGLDLRNKIADECLEYHNGSNTDKDIVLLEEVREVIRKRVEAIQARLKRPRQPIPDPPTLTKVIGSPHGQSAPPYAKPDVTMVSTLAVKPTNYLLPAIEQRIQNHDRQQINVVPPSRDLRQEDSASDDGYWEGMEDITMEDIKLIEEPASSSTQQTLSSTTTSNSFTSSIHYPEVMYHLRKTFGLQGFRNNQLEAIIASLEGRDVFVLMPTGGGKSLCYQLPAVCTTGETKGITVVVSPLIALMKDQVESLKKKHINAFLSNSEGKSDRGVLQLRGKDECKLWYVTPEKLRDSGATNEILEELYAANRLGHFVVDEAHCISTWGQDFRDAYTALGSLRERFPNVPIMALTATANKRAIADIEKQLKLRNHAFFSQSFNRTNLKYSVRKKAKNLLDEIFSYIQINHRGHSGIIYCTARQKCETVSAELNQRGLKAAHYHAGMSSLDKEAVVHEWMSDNIPVIVATIAFGMGIDKANVRFVIHHDMPKSLSGYYQETGRGGRDGKPADCVMFYSYQDFTALRNQINKDENSTPDAKQRQENAVREVYNFCENASECRRVQVLQHFEEKFDKKECARMCDVCEEDHETVPYDVTSHTRSVISLVQNIVSGLKEKITKTHLNSILRGANLSEIRKREHDKLTEFGCCSDLPKDLLDLFLDRLLFTEILSTVTHQNGSGYHNEYLALGPKAIPFVRKKESLILQFRPKPGKFTKTRKQQAVASISAPVRSRKGKQKALEDDPIEDLYDDDTFYFPEPFERSKADSVAEAPSSRAAVVPSGLPRVTIEPQSIEPAEELSQALYQKMLTLRRDIMNKENIQVEDDVLDDGVLQILSLTCPNDYRSFKRELGSAMDDGDPESATVSEKWDKYGQPFLQLCIQHTTNSMKCKASPQAFSAATLHSRYEFQPRPALSIVHSAQPSSLAPRPKFRPAPP